ncbi:MAG TPA: membrane dipeptidase, partial [Cystobacter sp.]
MQTPLPLLGLVLLAAVSCSHESLTRPAPSPGDSAERGRELAHRLIIVDGHIDVPYRLQEKLSPEGEPTEDISQRTSGGDFDYPRAVEGGLDVPFMSIYVPAELQKTAGASKALADSLIDMVEKLARASPDKFALARSVDEARRNTSEGKISFAMGRENGSALEDSV